MTAARAAAIRQAVIAPLHAEVRAGIYCRISQDKLGDELGVRRQEMLARKLCERNGWTVAEVYVDDDISAYSGKPRPAYRRMLDAVAARSINAVVAYDLDRLHRLPIELETFFNVCDGAGLTNMATVSGDIDLATSNGRMVARMLGAVAKKSSDDTSRRIKDKQDELAGLGLPSGGQVPFGYLDAMTIDPAMKIIFREMAGAVLAGETATQVARNMNTAGVPTPRGGKHGWSGQTVTQVLVSPRAAGLRQHRGVVIGPAAWPGLIDVETHERLKVRLTPGEARAPRHKSLWTGFARCATCKRSLARNTHGRKPIVVWTCRAWVGVEDSGSCPTTAILADEFDAVMVKLVSARMRDLPGALVDDREPDAAALIATLEQESIEWGLDAGAGRCTRATAMVAIKGINERLVAARVAAVRQLGSAALIELMMMPGDVEINFGRLTLDRQRAVVAGLLDGVYVSPGGARQIEGRIRVGWLG